MDACEENPELCCTICFQPFDARKPPVCLPCKVPAGTETRHCVMCMSCFNRLLKWNKKADYISCPFCRHRFDKIQLQQALRLGCLAFPPETPVSHYLQRYSKEEVENKPQCFDHLRRGRVLSRDYIQQNLPRVCEQLRQHMPGTKELVDTLQKHLFLPSPESYIDKWHLDYSISPSEDPFPMNLDSVVIIRVNLFQYCTSKPWHWRNWFTEECTFEEFDRVSQAWSLVLSAMTKLIDLLRGSGNRGSLIIYNVPHS